MERLIDVASYIYNRYMESKHEKIDEMKLHKLLYFAQRESLIQNSEPLFCETFYGWRFGPVLKEIRNAYKENLFLKEVDFDCIERITPIMNKVFDEYADKSSWSLSRLTHGEVSWKKSRIGIPDGVNSDNPIEINDILIDAERIKQRRANLATLGLV